MTRTVTDINGIRVVADPAVPEGALFATGDAADPEAPGAYRMLTLLHPDERAALAAAADKLDEFANILAVKQLAWADDDHRRWLLVETTLRYLFAPIKRDHLTSQFFGSTEIVLTKNVGRVHQWTIRVVRNTGRVRFEGVIDNDAKDIIAVAVVIARKES